MEGLVDVCVIGAGIGGLSTALALQQIGLTVRVIERDISMEDRKQGYGLTLTNSLTGPLSKLGLLDECIEHNCPSHCHFIFNPQGEIKGYFGRAIKDIGRVEKPAYQLADQGGNRGNLRIPRQELRKMMISRLHHDTILWGYKLDSYEENNSHVSISLKCVQPGKKDETISMSCCVLIGADGLWSRVRRIYDPYASMHFLGITVILGISSISDPLLTNMGYYILDGTHRLFTMPFLPCTTEDSDLCHSARNPLIMWQLSFSGLSEEEAIALKNSSLETILSTALNKVQHWMPAVRNLLEATIQQEVWATPLYDRDAMNVSALHAKEHKSSSCGGGNGNVGRITVVGDACHPMSMFKGQGANQALEDAVHLAEMLQRTLDKQNQHHRHNKAWPNHARRGEGEGGGAGAGMKRPRDSESPPSQPSPSSGCLLSVLPPRLLGSALRQFEREMVARTSKKVMASREAATVLHSSKVFDDLPLSSEGAAAAGGAGEGGNGADSIWKIAGVEMKDYLRFTEELRTCNITATSCAAELEEKLVQVYQRLLCSESVGKK